MVPLDSGQQLVHVRILNSDIELPVKPKSLLVFLVHDDRASSDTPRVMCQKNVFGGKS